MSRNRIFLLAAFVTFLAAFSFVTTRSLSGVVVAVLAAGVGFLLARAFSGKPRLPSSDAASVEHKKSGTSEIFALGKLFEATLDGMREGLLVVDSDMRVVASNPAAHRLFNFSSTHRTGQRLTELTRNPAIYDAFLDALKGNERTGVEVETHDPARHVFDLRVIPLAAGDGRETSGAIGIFFDVTQLERLERVRQEFLSNVSHELRTPLTAVLAFVETLESGALEDRQNSQRFLAIIRRNAERMQNLIDDILELSAIEAGNVGVQLEQVQVAPLVNDVITALAAKASSRNVDVRNEVPRGTVAMVDPRRLEQMITNLVDNAIKFNREGGIVTVGCVNGVRTRIFVKDTGEGIPAQHLGRLCERFYRVDRARSSEMGGTGLGLAIVKHLARAHGGEVHVTSELGQGSVFEIDLPGVDEVGRD